MWVVGGSYSLSVFLGIQKMVVGFLEDQSRSVYPWRSAFDGQTYTLAGLKGYMHLLNSDMEIVASTQKISPVSPIVRLIGVSDNTSVFFATGSGGCGFVSTNPNSFSQSDLKTFGKSDLTVVDADLHGSGNIAGLLTETQIALLDPQRETALFSIPVGQTGSSNCMRFADPNHVVSGSLIASIFDIRTAQTKNGFPSSVLFTGSEFSGRAFTAMDSDGNNSVVGGDSAGGMWLWDIRKSGEILKSVHAHSGAVLSFGMSSGQVASSGADGSVSLWSLVDQATTPSFHPKKKLKKILISDPSDGLVLSTSASVKRMAVEGSGAALSVSIEDSATPDSKHLAYVTDTGLAVLTPLSAFYL
jgi:hypothetical protein